MKSFEVLLCDESWDQITIEADKFEITNEGIKFIKNTQIVAFIPLNKLVAISEEN